MARSNQMQHVTTRPNVGAGVASGVVAGACWGLVFIAPSVTPDFSPLQLSAGRYLAYGLVAAVLIVPRWRTLTAALEGAEWRALVWLSLAGNVLYYVLLAGAVQLAGAAPTTLVIGFMPIAVTLIGSRRQDAVRLRRLVPSLALGAAAIICIVWPALTASNGPRVRHLEGLVLAFGALASWTAYAVGNSRWLARLDRVSGHEWSLLTGLVTGAQALLLAALAFLPPDHAHTSHGWLRFGLVVSGIAMLSSVVGNAFWNRASRLLPLTLTGQMILFETLFALLYSFAWEARLPTGLEVAAVALLTASVLSGASAHTAGLGRVS